jgi:hypothetical protein
VISESADAYTDSSAIFVSGHAGTGFLWNAIATALWAEELVVLAASPGVDSLFPASCSTGHSCLWSYFCKLGVMRWQCHCKRR